MPIWSQSPKDFRPVRLVAEKLAQLAGSCCAGPMGRHQTVKQDGGTQLVRIGGRAYRVRTQVVVEEVDCEDPDVLASGEAQQCPDGAFQLMLSEDDAVSIDKSEQAILGTAWPAMRSALAEHLHCTRYPKKS